MYFISKCTIIEAYYAIILQSTPDWNTMKETFFFLNIIYWACSITI